WIGFDAESGAHRIYFEDHRNIAIEHNVSFDRQIEEGPALAPHSLIERESETTKVNQQMPHHQAPMNTHQSSNPPQVQTPPNDSLGPNFEHAPTPYYQVTLPFFLDSLTYDFSSHYSDFIPCISILFHVFLFISIYFCLFLFFF
ncbi:hypothetical protein CY34DRAFT_95844, partial [Suillus luteus UH-Slu-Lm8-n1]